MCYRAPIKNEIISEWNKSISNHQKHETGQSYMICERHFSATDFVLQRGKRVLKQHAIPTIFNDETSTAQNMPVPKDKQCRAPRKQYCKIKHCRYEVGTTDKCVLFSK